MLWNGAVLCTDVNVEAACTEDGTAFAMLMNGVRGIDSIGSRPFESKDSSPRPPTHDHESVVLEIGVLVNPTAATVHIVPSR